MDNYMILTDTTTDLPQEFADELGIKAMPLSFKMEDKNYYNYLDYREYPIDKFYSKLREGKLAVTAQVNVSEFISAFKEYLDKGLDILYIAFSSGLSGTYNSAQVAAKELREEYKDRKIYIIDSLAASMGEGLLVYHAVMKKREGFSIDELKDWLIENRNKLCHWFTVDDLHHLKRGGRVSSAAAVMGSMLGIKPVLHVDDEGHLIPVEKVRGRRKSLDRLVDHMEDSCIDPHNQVIFISHGDCIDDVNYIKDQINKRLKPKDIVVNYVGPVKGSHSGPGTMAIFFIGKQK